MNKQETQKKKRKKSRSRRTHLNENVVQGKVWQCGRSSREKEIENYRAKMVVPTWWRRGGREDSVSGKYAIWVHRYCKIISIIGTLSYKYENAIRAENWIENNRSLRSIGIESSFRCEPEIVLWRNQGSEKENVGNVTTTRYIQLLKRHKLAPVVVNEETESIATFKRNTRRQLQRKHACEQTFKKGGSPGPNWSKKIYMNSRLSMSVSAPL